MMPVLLLPALLLLLLLTLADEDRGEHRGRRIDTLRRIGAVRVRRNGRLELEAPRGGPLVNRAVSNLGTQERRGGGSMGSRPR